MFPDPSQMRRRLGARLDVLAQNQWFRLGAAALLACIHLALFAKAGRDHLGLPFNNAPNAVPYYSDPDSPAVQGYPRQPHFHSRLIVSRWDAQHYIGFAVRGLTSCPTEKAPEGPWGDNAYLQCGLGWLPAYGLAGGLISDVTPVAPDVALMFISILAAIILNLLWTSQVFVERIGRLEAWMTLLAFNFYPAAFIVVAPYAEASTLALAIGGFACMARERWIAAGFLIGATTALRMGAVTFAAGLCCAAVYAAWRKRAQGDAAWWRPLIAVPLSGWGQLVTLAAFRFTVGDAFAYLRARDSFGDQRDFTKLLDPEFYLKGFTAQHMDSVMIVGSIAIIALVGRELLKRFKREEAIFLVVSSATAILLGASAVHEYWGLNRYLLTCPIIFFGAGVMARKHTAIFVLWAVLCAMIYWYVEMCSYVAQGHPGICPCLGRVEFFFPF